MEKNTETKPIIATNIDSSAMTEEQPVSTSSRHSEGGEPPAGRLKLFNKVMERSLNKYIDDARYVSLRYIKLVNDVLRHFPNDLTSLSV